MILKIKNTNLVNRVSVLLKKIIGFIMDILKCAGLKRRKVSFETTVGVVGKNLIVGRKTTGSGLYQIDPVGKTLQSTSNVDASSSGSGINIIYAANQNKIYQAAIERIEVYSATDQSYITSINVGSNAYWLCYAENTQKLYIRNTINTAGTLVVYDTVLGTTTTISGSFVGGVTYNSSNGKVYANRVDTASTPPLDEVVEIDPSTDTITNSGASFVGRATAIQYIAETGRLYVFKAAVGGSFVNKLLVVDITTLSVISETTIDTLISGQINVGTNIKYYNNKIYASFHVISPGSTLVGYIITFDSTSYTQLDVISFTSFSGSHLLTFTIVENTNTIVASIATSVYFLNPNVVYGGGDAANSFYNATVLTLATNGQAIYYNSIGYSETTSIDLFSQTSLPTGVSATMMGTYTYSQFVQSLLGTGISVCKISIYANRSVSTYNSQLVQTINFVRNTNLGTVAIDQQYPVLDPYQMQAAIVNIPVDTFKLDSLNYIGYTVFKGQNVQIAIQGEYIYENEIAKETGICPEEQEKIQLPVVQPEIRVVIVNPFKRLCS